VQLVNGFMQPRRTASGNGKPAAATARGRPVELAPTSALDQLGLLVQSRLPSEDAVLARFKQHIVPQFDNFARFLSRDADAAQDIVQEAFLPGGISADWHRHVASGARAKGIWGCLAPRGRIMTKPVLQPLPAIKLRCQEKSDWRSAVQAFFRCSLASAIQINRSHAILGAGASGIYLDGRWSL
jgi:hypothetical protein